MATESVQNVWVVMHCYWEDPVNIAVFDTEAAAVEFSDRPNLHWDGPFPVNSPDRALPD